MSDLTNSDLAKGLVKLSQNRETMIKIFDMAMKGDPDVELFITLGVRNKKKRVKKSTVINTPFGSYNEDKDVPEEIEVKERVDTDIVLGLATKWLVSINERITNYSKQFNQENERISNEVTRRTETEGT